jgi:eukaryotic-like serine/threonine-protein kinase
VMEFLEGETLARRLERGALPIRELLKIGVEIADALDKAHRAGLVHRDIKPANIYVCRMGLDYDFVKVLDFGLVKSTKPDDERSMATAVGLTPGTPAFMAPEMTMGDQIDGRADLYALGCVAYYLLTEVPVFTGDNLIQVMAKHLNVEPVPPSKRAGIRVPKGLERLVMALLAKNPADRPQTAGELARGLAEVEAEPWDAEQAARWWREHPVTP